MEHKETETGGQLLFSTENGSVHHCACHDVLVLRYHGHWMAMTRPQYRNFHAGLIQAVRCPLGQMRLNDGGRFVFQLSGGNAAFALDRAGMEDLLWLLDSARYMLDATETAVRGFRRDPE